MRDIALEKLIPQRSPIVMVDGLLEVEAERAVTSFTVRSDNYFIDTDGCLAEAGLIEHIAQSASAFVGYKAVEKGADAPPVGYIGEVKRFECRFRPRTGDRLLTVVSVMAEAEGVILIQGTTRTDGGIAAETQMKVYVKA